MDLEVVLRSPGRTLKQQLYQLLFLDSLDFFVSFLGQAKNEKPVRLEDN